MNARHFILALGLALPGAVSMTAPASAGIFDDIGHAVSKVTKPISRAAEHAVKDVGHAAGSVTKGIGHAVGSATRDVGHVASDVARGAGKAVTHLPQTYMKVAKPIGVAVSKYYNTVGTVAGKIPVFKDLAPVAKQLGKIARSKEAQIGAGIGLATVGLGGGLGAVLHHGGTAAGAGGLTAYYGKKGYERGKKEVNQTYHDLRKAATE